MPTVREIINALLNEMKAVLREHMHEAKNALKKRLQRFLITGTIVGVLITLVISLIGTAALFLLIGSLKYLSTFMPEWMAWSIMGLTSGILGGLFFFVLYIVIRKQLKTKQN